MSTNLPDFLFSGWRFRQGDITEAKARGDLDGWTVSSLCCAYLKYQLELYEEQRKGNDQEPLPSLALISVRKVFDSLSFSDNVHEELNILATSMHSWIKDVHHAPYLILRLLDISSATDVQGRKDIRKMIDIDEAILAGEQRIRTRQQELDDSYYVTLKDLAIIFGPSDKNGCIDIKRKTPPKGSFEFLDNRRKPAVKIHGSDALFIKTFNRVTKNVLKGLDWKNIFVQGGMVLNTLLHTDPTMDDDGDVATCDIDLYLYDLAPKEANRKVEEIHKVYSSNMKPIAEYVVIKTAKTVSFIPKYPERRLQIVLKLQHTPLESLLRVDLDACAIGFDGAQVFMLPRCARAIETGYNVFTMDLIWGHRMGDRRETQTYRVFKYASRGFGLRILASYVRALEKECSDDIATRIFDEGTYPAEEAETRTRSTSDFNEPGLKTVRRIARTAHNFVARIYYKGRPAVGSDGEDRPYINLNSLDISTTDSEIPDVRNSIGVLEVFMRKCAAWSLSALGLAFLDPEEESNMGYKLLEIYDGLPTYRWDATSTADMSIFRHNANRYNGYLFGVLRFALLEKLQLNPAPYFPADSWERYLTHRVRRLIAGDVIGSVQSMGFALPLVIPMALETFLGDLNCHCKELQENALSEILKPVHDPSRYTPKSARLPSPQDTWDESGNLRFWLISNKTMWAGQRRALDEVTELLLMLFSWFTRNQPFGSWRHNTDDPQCIWYIADFFRRRLILPKASRALQKGQNLSERESRLFRAWVLTRPPKRANFIRNHSDSVIARIEDELEREGDIEEKLFWQDGDEGLWDNEEGVPSWRDTDETLGLAGLSI